MAWGRCKNCPLDINLTINYTYKQEEKNMAQDATIKLDLGNLEALVAEADTIFLKPKAEAVLLKLLEAQAKVEDAIDRAKQKLEAAALAVNPNFKSIRGDKTKVFYRQYGERYKVDEAQITQVPPELYESQVKTTYKVIPEAVETWTQANKGMPIGIIEVDRKKSLTFALKDKPAKEVTHAA